MIKSLITLVLAVSSIANACPNLAGSWKGVCKLADGTFQKNARTQIFQSQCASVAIPGEGLAQVGMQFLSEQYVIDGTYTQSMYDYDGKRATMTEVSNAKWGADGKSLEASVFTTNDVARFKATNERVYSLDHDELTFTDKFNGINGTTPLPNGEVSCRYRRAK